MNGSMQVSTPKNQNANCLATSTVAKRKDPPACSIETSMSSILNLTDIDLSNIANTQDNLDELLQMRREKASTTLNRASRVPAIPSFLLKPDKAKNFSTGLQLEFDSTISETDLLTTKENTSTPRNSSNENLLMSESAAVPRESIFSKFRSILDTDISTENVLEEFKQIAQASRVGTNASLDSELFTPGELAQSRLIADELSWRKKNEIPLAPKQASFSDTCRPSMSTSVTIGEFFQKGSDDLAELLAPSPEKNQPVALWEPSIRPSVAEQLEASNSASNASAGASLSVSAIQRLLFEGTQDNIIEYLLKQSRNPSKKSSDPGKASESFSLPVSQNISCTSSLSDNEAVEFPVAARLADDVADKQIVCPKNQTFTSGSQKTQPSSAEEPPRSSSSLSSLPNGKLPIDSTVTELVWGCVKVDRSVTKQFLLRNKTPKTLRLQCCLSSHEFKIRKDIRSDSDQLTACKFVLHGHESRPLIISFTPTKIGAAFDELVFTPLDADLKQTKKQCVRLWGYGGYVCSEYHNVSRDNTGKYWMSLGRMDNRVQMNQSFTIKNTGNIPSFTYIKVVPKNLVTFTSLKVEPNLFVLLPSEERIIRITYIPNAKDCRILKQNLNVLPVVDIGKLEIVSGAEANRFRLRRLKRKCLDKRLTVDALTSMLSEPIQGEIYSSEFAMFRENTSAISDILENVNVKEMLVTIEQDPNQTLVAECPDDSVVFQSLWEQATFVGDAATVPRISFRMEPPSLMLFQSKPEDSLFLLSEANETLSYTVSSTPIGLLIRPTRGEIAPGDTAELKVKLPNNVNHSQFTVRVYVGSDQLESEVKILKVGSSQRRFLD
ncbi:uncharacterized protein LOC109543585 [Dendroctonus ponderosae]|uniref:uncharacterized protein LOC109543585 n=1 Tax=Dendroctonus ponderosae TaxID=77166 RepID=UPI002034C3E4|nr:uncharacterized protein LOC109543585 [Dendroctonus ponderosae]XP_048518037.1 uncharacterized protein LOC109543585 [Dendroctonus ponderosae]XP_048518038.1 uncharacterized protein LOC109543585 [Dendroctonus ponderosae]